MPHTLDFVKDKGYIHLRHSEEMTLSAIQGSQEGLLNLIQSHACNRILVELEKVDKLISTFEQYEFLLSSSKLLPDMVKIAVLVPPGLFMETRFSENVATNRGINYRVFSEKTHAVEWLTGDQ